MLKRIADDLLRRVYYPATALICWGRRERLIGVILFDTGFMEKERLIPFGTRRMDVICSHPDGRVMLTPEEIMNCSWIASRTSGVKLTVYVFGEDIGLLRVDSSEFSGYNETNIP